jgi:hypothetical protein
MKNNPSKQSSIVPERILPLIPLLPKLFYFLQIANDSNTINIKELNAQTTSIMNLDFGERSLRYQKLVKGMKAPSSSSRETTPEEVALSEDEREFMNKAARDIKSAFGSMKVKDVGQVVVGFNL